jgi:hypothetical protein
LIYEFEWPYCFPTDSDFIFFSNDFEPWLFFLHILLRSTVFWLFAWRLPFLFVEPLMLVPFRPPETKRFGMKTTLSEAGKAKEPKKNIFKRLSSSFWSPFSPKTVAPPQQVGDDFYSGEGDYMEDVAKQPSDAVAVAQPSSDDPHFSHKEEQVAFLNNGESLLNTPRPIRNLIGDSTAWRQDDWSTTVGKSLPRTPVNKPNFYPDLSAITKTVEPASDRVPLLPAPGIPGKRKRASNVKHQLPVRASERLKDRASQNLNNDNGAAANDNYLDYDSEYGKTKVTTTISKVPNHASNPIQRKTIKI